MTVFAYASDIHLEGSARDFDFPKADVLLLAGDICVVADLRDAFSETVFGSIQRQFFIDASANYDYIFWVPGNHEYWDGCIDNIIENVDKFFYSEGISNIMFAPMGSYIVNDVQIVFTTLWTDINKGNPIDMVAPGVNDYRHIMKFDDSLNSGIRYLTPQDTIDLHNQHKDYISANVIGHDKVVVMTHHTPNMISSSGHSTVSNSHYYCCNDMDDVILDNPQISHWICGHTHHNKEYKIGDTLVMSNCRGYKTEKMSATFKIKVFQV